MPFVRFQTIPYANNLKLTQMSPKDVLAGKVIGNFVPRRSERPLYRRPLEGIVLKERAPAYITVRRANGDFVLLNNTLGTNEGFANWSEAQEGVGEQYYTDFSLFQVQESRDEDFIPQKTFGETFAFFTDEQPRFLACSGALVNTADFQWRTIWWENYDKYLRGTKCVENRARVYLSWDDILVEGYIIKAAATDTAQDPHIIPFNFVMWVTNRFSLGVANLAALNAYKRASATARASELVGDRGTDMLVNGQRLEMEPGFLARQLDAVFGTQDPQEAVLRVVRDPTLLNNVPAYAKQQATGVTDGSLLREGLANPGAAFGTMGPALKYFGATEPSEETIGGIAKTSLASRTGLKAVFGENYRALNRISFITGTDLERAL